MKILFAEDDYASRKFTSAFLRKYGDVDTTINGEEAIAAFQIAIEEKNYYDLVCLDVMMPGRDGIEVLYSIREIEKREGIPADRRAKVFMISALSDGTHVGGAYELGCDAYAYKPLDIDEFEGLLEKFGLLAVKEDVLQ